MHPRRSRAWVFQGPVPLLADLRFGPVEEGSELLPRSALVWYSVPPTIEARVRDPCFIRLEGDHGCPRCGSAHPYVGLMYRGKRALLPEGREPIFPRPRWLSLICSALEEHSVLEEQADSSPMPRVGLDALFDSWLECRSKGRDVALFAGAGISKASAVPTTGDLRVRAGVSPATREGLKKGLRDPAAMFEVLADLVRSVDWGDARPSRCHHLVRALTDEGVVDWVLTSNGDRLLEEVAVKVLRVFDRGEAESWQRAVEGGEARHEGYRRFARRLRDGRVGLFLSVGASRLVARELGPEIEKILVRQRVPLFQINPASPVPARGSRWVPLTGERALAGLLERCTTGRRYGRNPQDPGTAGGE